MSIPLKRIALPLSIAGGIACIMSIRLELAPGWEPLLWVGGILLPLIALYLSFLAPLLRERAELRAAEQEPSAELNPASTGYGKR